MKLDQIDRKRSLGILATLTPALLAVLYFAHTVIYIWFELPNSRDVPAPNWLAYFTGPSGIVFLCAALWIHNRPVCEKVEERWIGVLCLVVLLNVTAHYTVSGDAWVSFIFGTVMMAFGLVSTSPRWYIFLCLAAVAGHITGSYLSPTIVGSDWQIVVGLDVICLMISMILFLTRRAGLSKLEALRKEATLRQAIADEALGHTERARLDMQQLIEKAPDAVLILFGDTIHYANSAFLESMRRPRSYVEGKTIRALSDDGVISDTGASRVTFQRCDGEYILFQFSEITDIRHDGKDATLLIGQDVTDRDADLQAKLQLADRMAAIGVLASGVAHEINNPLTYVIGNLSALQDQQQYFTKGMPEHNKEEFQELIEESLQGAERVAAIVRDLNALARSNSEEKKASVSAAAESSVRIAEPHLKLIANVVVDLEELAPVACSHSRLSQVLLNLVINAAHALDTSKTNMITLRGRMAGHSAVRIEVQDTGKGMDAETQRRLFEPFYTTKAVGDGTGLGLYYCMNEIKRAGGDLSFTSTLGVGTTFIITLPIYENSEQPAPAPVIRKELPDLSILVIDDEPMVCRTLERMLEGKNITVARDADVAWDHLQNEHFDLIFCDLMMPKVNGRDFYARAEIAIPGIGERFIFITGGAFTPETISFMEKKKSQVLLKPFQLQDLHQSIRKLLYG